MPFVVDSAAGFGVLRLIELYKGLRVPKPIAHLFSVFALLLAVAHRFDLWRCHYLLVCLLLLTPPLQALAFFVL